MGDYEKRYGLDIVYNPEFLREQSSVDDFINCDLIVLGGDQNWCEMVAQLYRRRSLVNICPYYITAARTASLFKYTLNLLDCNSHKNLYFSIRLNKRDVSC